MSDYNPDKSAVLTGRLSTAELSQRDISLRVPINFVTVPGVSLTAACFSDNRFENGPAQECFSNLMSIGFRRFVIDLYWDPSQPSWSLCPVQLKSGETTTPATSQNASVSIAAQSQTASSSAVLTAATLNVSPNDGKKDAMTAVLSERVITPVSDVQSRQTSGEFVATARDQGLTSARGSTILAVSQTGKPGSSMNARAGSPSATSKDGEERYQNGPYTCDPKLGLNNITDALSIHIKDTENTLNATLRYVVFNLHSAAAYDDPTGVPPTTSESLLPGEGNYVSELFNSSLSSYTYTPGALRTQREHLNSSWFAVGYDYRPLEQYLDLQTYPDGNLYTNDGWPSESFLEFQHGLRVLASFGTVDSQIAGYNLVADYDTIFPPGYLSRAFNLTFNNSTGAVEDGCLFDPNTTSLSAVNTSWAMSRDIDAPANDTMGVSLDAGNATLCGVSPLLAVSLGDSTADENITSYLEYIRHTIWSWADTEPSDTDRSSDNSHCAVFNYNNGGRWQVADCGATHYGACRVNQEPYNWTITHQSGVFDTMGGACRDTAAFSAPRTPMENAYLRQAVRDWIPRVDDDDGSRLFWIDLNDADVTGCWVNGVNATCPYARDHRDPTRTVVIPTVAGVIVFVIAIIIIFVKCAGNRQTARRRKRRGDGNWEYEGVPS